MPIYAGENNVISNRKAELVALSGVTLNTTDFTDLEQHSNDLSATNLVDPDPAITVDGVEVSEFNFLQFTVTNAEAGGSIMSALLIKRGLNPGEEVTVSGYFFKGIHPTTNNNRGCNTPIVLVYETDSANYADFQAYPDANNYTGVDDVASIIGQGIVPASDGTNVGAINGGWKYNTATGRSAAATTQAQNAANNADQTDASLFPFPNLSSEGTWQSRFHTITVRNDTSSVAYLKLTAYDTSGTINDSGDNFSVHDLRVQFDEGSDFGRISSVTNSSLSIQSDKSVTIQSDNIQTRRIHATGVSELRVYGNNTGDARIRIDNGTSNHYIFDDQSDSNNFKIESAAGKALCFNTNGINERMRISSDGFVGILNNDPQAALDVTGDVKISGEISTQVQSPTLFLQKSDNYPKITTRRVLNSDPSSGAFLMQQRFEIHNGSNVVDAGRLVLTAGANWDSSFPPSCPANLEIKLNPPSGDASGNYTAMMIKGGGTDTKVGIGMDDPDQALEVCGAIHISGETTTPNAPADGDGGIIYVKSDGKLYFRSNEVEETNLGTITTGDISQVTGNTSPLTIASSKVAVGTTPTADGHASGYFNIYNTSLNALTDVGEPQNYHMLIQCSTSNGSSAGIAFGSSASNVGAAIIYKDTSSFAKGELQFYTKQTTGDEFNPTQTMVMSDAGKVGIGVSSPTAKLHVDGDMIVTQMQQYISVTMTSETNSNSSEFNPFDADNTSNYASTTNASNGITYTSSDGKFTILHAGVYEVNIIMYMHSTGSPDLLAKFSLVKNGSTEIWEADGTAVYNVVSPVETTISGIFTFAASDYLEVKIDGVNNVTVHNGSTVNIKRIA